MPWPPKSWKNAAFSEEDVCMISKEAPCAIWAGTKVLYSGDATATPQQASGYNYKSGETDIEPINYSGWGEIRIPELNQLHKIFVFPKDPSIVARANYTALTVSTASGQPSGHGGCSGKIALLEYASFCASGKWAVPMGCSNLIWESGYYSSGLVDVIAFGSQM